MTDAALAIFLGIDKEPKCAEVIAHMTPERRASYERMAGMETELKLWQAGLAPKPNGVLIDYARGRRSR